MIVEISYDIRYFLLILGIAVVGFANGFFLLSNNNEDVEN
jgi:hypothetical protein